MSGVGGQSQDAMLAFIRAHAYRKLNQADEALAILERSVTRTPSPGSPLSWA